MSGRTDPIIREVRRRMVRARSIIREGARELEKARREVQRHPDFKVSQRGRAAKKPMREWMTLAWWADSCLGSIIEEAPLFDAEGWISDDLSTMRQTMEECIKDEEETLARFARRAARAA